MLLLLLAHSVPDLVSLRIDANVEDLCTNEDKNVVNTDADEDAVSTAIERLIIVAVDLHCVSAFM